MCVLLWDAGAFCPVILSVVSHCLCWRRQRKNNHFRSICSSTWDVTEPTTKKIFPHKVIPDCVHCTFSRVISLSFAKTWTKVTVARSVRCRSNNIWRTELRPQCFQRHWSICRHRLQFHDPQPKLHLWARVEQKLSRWKHWTSRSGS